MPEQDGGGVYRKKGGGYVDTGDRRSHVEPVLPDPTKVPQRRRRRTAEGVAVRAFVVMIALGVLNGAIHSGPLGLVLSWAWLLWMYLVIGIIVTSLFQSTVGRDTQLKRWFDWAEAYIEGEFASRRRLQATDPNRLAKRYWKGEIDWHELDMRVGAAMGVIKDVERLRAFEALGTVDVDPRPADTGGVCQCDVCRQSLAQPADGLALEREWRCDDDEPAEF